MRARSWLAATFFCLYSVSCVAAGGDIPGYVMEIGTKRISEHLFRFTRHNAESPYPCLKLELIAPAEDWAVVEKKEICEMNGKNLEHDYAYASFGALSFTDEALLFQFTFFDKTSPGEYIQDCAIPLGNRIGNLQCTAPEMLSD
ncbi:hypothetical protein BN1049_00122 [Pseudomonas saudimassiliensis]|uniref:Lipoprotein n=1 Tax=Pseudomonas saudimassiliensis TaxID=1461581 RepID=A0A078M338_9PSED|nr:hypothetical protein [Pseudomonas saudimassiliensis]CEA00639.1 hypothetical protein BN1049_00122 [Pseudomonas saudimassiliensis]CEF25220.1 hypothetical protein BN1049_00122 [Pseudomonas saudimassiliensis]